MKDILETRQTLLETDRLRRDIAGKEDWNAIGQELYEGEDYIGSLKNDKVARFVARIRNIFVRLSNLTMVYRSKLADREAMVREMDDEE